MDWIRVDTALPTHRKSAELAQILDEPLAFGLMVRLWCWAKANAPHGRVSGRNPTRLVEGAVGWAGPPGAFVAAALEVGFLEQASDDLELHDWEKHNGRALKRAEASAERARRWREKCEAERISQREARMGMVAAAWAQERVRNAFGVRSRTGNETDETNETDRREATAMAEPPTAPPVFRLEGERPTSTSKAKPSPAQNLREQLRSMRTAALPGVVDDVELKPAALTRAFERLEHEAAAKGATVFEAYTAYLQDDYARSRNPPCPLSLFVDGNKYRGCLSAALRSRGEGPARARVGNREAGGYASLEEIEAQEFVVDPIGGDPYQEMP
jgi:hypothetical protein